MLSIFSIFKIAMYGQLENPIIYRLYVTYLTNLFSKYLQSEDVDVLIKIQTILLDENTKRKMSFLVPLLSSLELICSKMV
jgi:hypothetical protein